MHPRSHLVHPPQRRLDLRPLPLDHVKLNAQRGQRRQDVTEEDDAVGLERAPGLRGWSVCVGGGINRKDVGAEGALLRAGAYGCAWGGGPMSLRCMGCHPHSNSQMNRRWTRCCARPCSPRTWRDSSMAISGVSERSLKGYLLEYLGREGVQWSPVVLRGAGDQLAAVSPVSCCDSSRARHRWRPYTHSLKAAMYLPAWRMSHTGVRSASARARMRCGWAWPRLATACMHAACKHR